jgi:hypothetical protein
MDTFLKRTAAELAYCLTASDDISTGRETQPDGVGSGVDIQIYPASVLSSSSASFSSTSAAVGA